MFLMHCMVKTVKSVTTPHTDLRRSEFLLFILQNLLQCSLEQSTYARGLSTSVRIQVFTSFPEWIHSLSWQGRDFSKLENVQTESGAHSAS